MNQEVAEETADLEKVTRTHSSNYHLVAVGFVLEGDERATVWDMSLGYEMIDNCDSNGNYDVSLHGEKKFSSPPVGRISSLSYVPRFNEKGSGMTLTFEEFQKLSRPYKIARKTDVTITSREV